MAIPDIQKELTRNIGTTRNKLKEFIREKIFDDFNKKGAIIGVSGGIDSAVSLTLCVEGLGSENVYGLILPEKESSPSSAVLAEKLCNSLHVAYETFPIAPILEAMGIYAKKEAIIQNIFPNYDAAVHSTSLTLPGDAIHHEAFNVPVLNLVADNSVIAKKRLSSRDYLDMIGLQNVKQRSRMMVQYMFAESRMYAVCGTTNKSELVTGHFVKYGDGGVDIEPIADCYKTQVYALADVMGISREIINRPPSPDTWSHYTSDMDFYWRMPFEILDQLLYAEEHGLSIETIEKNTHLAREEILRAYKHIAIMKNNAKFVSMIPPVYHI